MADSCTGESKYYVGDIGTKIIVDTCTDCTAATVRRLVVLKPDNTTVTWVATQEGTTQITYTTILGDFDQAGDYRLQAYLEIAGFHGYGVTARFRVHARFT